MPDSVYTEVVPAPPLLSPSQQQVADALMADLNMPDRDADKVARAYRGDDPAGPPKDDDPLIDYATMFSDWGVEPNQIADWMLAPGPDRHKRLHYRLGYTSKQYTRAYPVIEALHDTGNDLTANEPGAVKRWHSLLSTVPPDFLALCIRAGVSGEDEIASYETRRVAGDPDVQGELTMLAGFLKDA